jgi:hypothetical protein
MVRGFALKKLFGKGTREENFLKEVFPRTPFQEL